MTRTPCEAPVIGSWYAYAACSASYRLTYGPTFVRASVGVVWAALYGFLALYHFIMTPESMGNPAPERS